VRGAPERADGRAAHDSGALSHVKVLDLSWVAAGPLVGAIFAQYGATVVKVESAVRLDVARSSPPMAKEGRAIDRSGYFAAMNLGKLGVAVDINNPRGTEVMRRLVDWADIVIEGFTPGTLARWGLDYDSLSTRKPDIILISMTLQGQTGPSATVPGYGLQVHGMSGMGTLIGWPDGPPTGVTLAYPDYIVPMFAAFAGIAALDHRDRTGEGQHIDVSQMEAMINVTGTAIADYDVNGRTQLRDGNRLLAGEAPRAAPHGVYPVRGEDRWITIAVTNDEEWRAFCDVLGKGDWLADGRFATNDDRSTHDNELDELVADATSNREGRELMVALQRGGVPAGIALDQEGLGSDPQLRHRGHFVPVPHGGWGEQLGELFGARLLETPPAVQRAAPTLAQHNEHVGREILGFSQDEFDALLAEGAFELYGAD
jgi:benzylsuccinate CoA-transferase BbsF subunit